MKIAHVAFADTGGAAAAAYRLHISLLESGVDSSFHVVKQVGSWPGCHIMSQNPTSAGLIRSASGWVLQKLVNRTCRKPNAIQLQWTDCGYLSSLEGAYDVIHFHWVDGHVASIYEIAQMETPIVWTLHDIRAFSGGHYYKGFGCLKNSELHYDMSSLEENLAVRANQLVKQMVLKKLDIHAIAPSRWMHQEAYQSEFFREDHLHYIPYGIAEIPSPQELRTTERASFGLNENDKVLLYGADSVGYPRKGHDLLMSALQWIEDNHPDAGKINFFTFGKGEFTASGSFSDRHRHFGHVGSEDQMNRLYALADVFVAPSREDNLPNVVLESLRCGTPVAAFAIGGMPDMIMDGVNGRLAIPFSPASLGQAIMDLMEGVLDDKSISRNQIIQRVLNSFGLEKQAKDVMAVYRKCIR